MNPIIVPSEAALSELQRLRALAPRAIAGGNPREQVERKIARWCAIAAWFGAVLPKECRIEREQVWPEQHQASRHGGPQRSGGGISGGASTRAQRDDTGTLWTDHAPKGMPAADWRTEIAKELRRDTLAALARVDAHPPPPGEGDHSQNGGGAPASNAALTRAAALLHLDNYLSVAAGLPPIGAADGLAQSPQSHEGRKAA